MRNAFDEFTRRLGTAKERISELGDRSITEMQREKKYEKNRTKHPRTVEQHQKV